jgi:hypothetical protein
MRLNLPPTRLRLFGQTRETPRLVSQLREALRLLSQEKEAKRARLAPSLRRGVTTTENAPLFRGLRLKKVETFFLNLVAIGLPPLFAALNMKVAGVKQNSLRDYVEGQFNPKRQSPEDPNSRLDVKHCPASQEQAACCLSMIPANELDRLMLHGSDQFDS